MHPELEYHATAWRAVMPLIRPKNMPEHIHPRLLDDLYPLTVADVYTRTYKALIHPAVPGRFKRELLVALGHGTDLHRLGLHLNHYDWTATDVRRARVWDSLNHSRTTRVAHSTFASAYRNLVTVGAFLSHVNRDLQPGHPLVVADMVAILINRADLPQICADCVATAEPLMRAERR